MLSLGLMLLLGGIVAYMRAKGWMIALAAFVGALIGGCYWLALLPLVVGLVFCLPVVQNIYMPKVFSMFKKVTPPMSETEQEAINAGTVWWDGELFSGKPDYQKLLNYPNPQLTAEEQAFIDGPVEVLCNMLNDWQINHELKDLPQEAWDFIKEQGFLGMIVKKQYGGLEFSNYAHAKVVTKIATRCGSAAVTVMVPNSLGPGELLQHYGTDAQKDYYLPRLAKGVDIPCFALTSPSAGSDAGGIPDFGVVTRGSYIDPRTGERHEDVLGVRVSWEKRWITLAPVATVLGLAFKMYDPDGLLGEKKDIGITCALVPAEYEGVNIGRRHWPSGSAFMNGPTWGADVFIPLDWIIGGVAYAGRGWQMLVECLSVGRCISLPANSVAGGLATSYTTSLYSRIRDQFGLPIGKFEGVDEALARIISNTYQMEASQDLALTGLDIGEKPSVISAMLKYHNTERLRKVLNDAMDIHGGRTVVQGPRNYLVAAYQAIPIAITVEGANILTRSLMIFGQGAIRSHPYVLREMMAANNNDAAAFNQAFTKHVHFVITNIVRSFWLGLTNGCWSSSPRKGVVAPYYKQMNRLAANFALLTDMCMFSLGGSLKFKEKLSARLGDIASNLYICSAVLKRFERDGSPKSDEVIMQYAAQQALYDAQVAMDGVLKNLPNRPIAWILRVLTMPVGHNINAPSDKLGSKVANEMMKGEESLNRLTRFMFKPQDEQDPIGVLAPAHAAVLAAESAEKKVRKLERDNQLSAASPALRLQEALDSAFITQQEYDLIVRSRQLKRQVVMVDDFDMQLEQHDDKLLERHVF
ncbi:acyl-CoA dehydrogenase [Vitreoscilla sp. C1]|uniref:acyl-CoA dehydrogenase n=1 Tax=Vitreoscilla sp. (strain C1) TaxID=96942 RepID=UPI00148ED3E0|nr:acyl-CoA dehydrogenase [Vitreoscilla sp. C1]AUZ03964.2 acyl-CoA dehydrogenase [Vitreoscilla sp. C1]